MVNKLQGILGGKKLIIALLFVLMVFPFITSAADFSLSISSGGGWNAGGLSRTGLPSGSIMGIVENIMFWLLGILGLAGVIGFVIAGILYLLSTGDETMIERAKAAMKWSILGVAVGLLGVVIIQAISLMLNAASRF